jgi:hypothetical protein
MWRNRDTHSKIKYLFHAPVVIPSDTLIAICSGTEEGLG